MVSKIENIASIPNVDYVGITIEERDLKISNYINSFNRNFPVSKKAGLMDFFKLVQDVVKVKQDYDSVPIDKRLLFLAECPDIPIDTESITYELYSRQPGQFSQGSAGQGTIREVTPHIRDIRDHPDHIGEKLVTVGQFYDNTILFNIYARTDYSAIERVLWFEKLITSFKWYFSSHGIDKIIEQTVNKRENVSINNLILVKYSIGYFIRTEDVFHFGTHELKHIDLNVNILTR